MKKLLPIAAILILACTAVYLLQDPVNAPELGKSVACNLLSPDNRSADIERPDLSQPAIKGDTPDATPAPKLPAKPADTEPAVEEEPLIQVHTPDYGPLLKRGNGRVDFRLVDAKGRECDVPKGDDLKLFRKLGAYWIKDGVRSDEATNRVVCDGVAPQAGLEPSNYELELESSTLGAVRHAFSVTKNEVRTDTIPMPNYLRRICIRFVDTNGKPVPYIPSTPSRAVYAVELESVKRKSPNLYFLKTPPKDRRSSIGLGGGIGGGRGGSGGFRRRQVLFPTDDGRWYVLVWAGAKTTVRISLGEKVWGVKQLEFTGDFKDPKWDEHEVVLDLCENFEETVAKYHRYAGYSNGKATETLNILNGTSPGPDTRPVKAGHARVIATIEPLAAGRPLIKSEDLQKKSYGFRERAGKWICELPAGIPIEIELLDEDLSTWPCQTLFLQEGEIRAVTFRPNVIQPLMSTTGMPPTLRESALGFNWSTTIRAKVDNGYETEHLRLPFVRVGENFSIPRRYFTREAVWRSRFQAIQCRLRYRGCALLGTSRPLETRAPTRDGPWQ
ncbi:hypothetical protein OAU50_03875 [Planctomycetota bacterium]|nr:hypothetical protein [Planctomycetota bacterium]